MAKRNNEFSFDESGDCSREVQEQLKKTVGAFEQAKWSQQFQVLLELGITLPPPDKLADAELNIKLREVINALALMGAYLEHTDHLSDRELYILLWGDILLEETVIPSPGVTMVYHIDLIGSGSEEDNNIFLKYYADEDERTLWVQDFPDKQLPSRELLPYDRDRQLPKPDPQEKFGVH